MNTTVIIQSLFLVLVTALIGGVAAKLLKLPIILGVIFAGVAGGAIVNIEGGTIEALAEVGIIFLMFSLGLEFSWSRFGKFGKLVFLGSLAQIILVTAVSFFVLFFFFHLTAIAAIILSAGFSLSSTAIVVKMLSDRGEISTIHGGIMVGWLLVQDLAVIPMVVLISGMTGGMQNVLFLSLKLVATAGLLLVAVFVVGKIVVPKVMRLVAGTGSRELLTISGVTLAVGIAIAVTAFGVAPSFGAFLAGLIIADTQESHAIFAETRPLRDLFSYMFFVTLGFLVSPIFITSHLFLVIFISLIVLTIKVVVTFLVCRIFNYKGRHAIAVSLGLSQVGEFSFVLFLIAKKLTLIDPATASLGMAVTLVTLLTTPLAFKAMVPIWRKLKSYKFFSRRGTSLDVFKGQEPATDHIIICGFGRMGKWVGKALSDLSVPFIVIDYNQRVVSDAKKSGIIAIFGDPGQSEVLEAANIKEAKAVIISLPDNISREEIITYCQNFAPNVRIIVRAHLDEDVKKLSQLKVKKVIQPEFEGAIAVVRDILSTSGHDTHEVAVRIKNLRLSHSMKTLL